VGFSGFGQSCRCPAALAGEGEGGGAVAGGGFTEFFAQDIEDFVAVFDL